MLTGTEVKIAQLSLPFVNKIVDSWFGPKFDSWLKESKINRQLLKESIADKFHTYLNGIYDKYSYMNTIVFGSQQKKLNDLYIPLHIVSSRDNSIVKIESYDKELVDTYEKILITDTGGMGKSTLLKKMLLSCIENNLGIPLFFELRKLTAGTNVIEEIVKILTGIGLEDIVDSDFVKFLLKRGDFIFFLDGFDEIPFQNKDHVSRYIHEIVNLAGNNKFIMTSRPESALSSFGEFQSFYIRPLQLQESFELINKYDNNGELSKKLIAKIKDSDNLKNINEFLTNPLLVSLLYKAYDYKPMLPFKKHLFYRQVYDSLFETHDLTKDGSFIRETKSKLDIDDFHRILRVLGMISLKLNKIEFEKDELLKYINESKNYCVGLGFKNSDFLFDLTVNIPLFRIDGSMFIWAHKSIQEYFAAQYICVDSKSEQEKTILKLYKSPNYRSYINVLELVYDMDYKAFRNSVIYDMVLEFLEHCKANYVNKYYEHFGKDLNYRKSLTFARIVPIRRFKRSVSFSYDDSEYGEFFRSADNEVKKGKFDGVGIKVLDEKEDEYFKRTRIVNMECNKSLVINLLYRKSEPFVIALDNNFKRGFALLLLESTTFFLDDNIESNFNSISDFNAINDLIISYTSRYHLSKEECEKVKLEIEKEKEQIKQSEDFILNL